MHRFIPGRRIWLWAAVVVALATSAGACSEKVATLSTATGDSAPAAMQAPPTTVAPTTMAPTTTAAPATTRPRVATTIRRATPTTHRATPTTAAPARNCDPAYPDACLHDGIGDYDCAGGSGNGPNYAQGPVRVRPPDPFDLDRDGDGTGCES